MLWKNYPTNLWRQHRRLIIRGQWAIFREALGAWRGTAARATLRGQLSGLLTGIRFWRTRRHIQTTRRLPDEQLTALLTPVDEGKAGKVSSAG
jgi:hypothetical protein